MASSVDSDLANETLIAQLIVADLEEALRLHKGKAPLGRPLPDGQLAITEQLRVARNHLAYLEDSCVAENLAWALLLDQDQLDTFSSINQGEQDDHLAALALSRGQTLPAPSPSQQSLGKPLTTGGSDFLFDFEVDRSPSPLPAYVEIDNVSSLISNLTINKPVESRPTAGSSAATRLECIICGDAVHAYRRGALVKGNFHAPCGHHYCRGCIADLVGTAIRDEALFPLRCCHQNFELSDLKSFLTASIYTQARAKAFEFGTPSSNRLYCWNPACSVFLGPAGDTKGSVLCPECFMVVCSACKNKEHPGEACAENAAVLEVRALARAQRWQTCPGCNAIVELNQGCFHMTCRCRQSFCYLCAAPWKTCGCRQWDEDRLYDAAERQVNAEFGANAVRARPAVHAERVHQRVEELRVNHDCVNHSWMYRHGGGYCEGCNFQLPSFMMRCVTCQLLVCKRCSRNRF